MKNSNITNKERRRIIDLYLNGRQVSEISQTFKFKKPTIYVIIKKYNQTGIIEKGLKGGVRKQAISDSNKTVIQSWIDGNCGITLGAIKQRCLDKMILFVSISTIDRCIKSFNYSFKLVKNIPEKRIDDEVIRKRAEYADGFMNLISEINDEKIFFIYEVGFNISIRTKAGRSSKNTRPFHIVPGLRNRNISVCCAINKNGIINYKSQDKAFNSECFYDFMTSLIHILHEKSIYSAVFIMDNVPFHKVEQIKILVVSK